MPVAFTVLCAILSWSHVARGMAHGYDTTWCFEHTTVIAPVLWQGHGDHVHKEGQRMGDSTQKEGIVPVVSAIDWSYVPVYSVFLASFLDHASPDRRYELILLTDNVPQAAITALRVQAHRYANVSLRTIDMSNYAVPDFSVHGKYTKATFFRLMIPELLPEYGRVIYLDSDIVVLSDVAELFDAYSTGLAAAVLDFEMQGMLRDRTFCMSSSLTWTGREYLEKYCGMTTDQMLRYFNAGVLVLNLKEIRKYKKTQDCLELLNSKVFVHVDQDILNIAFAGQVQIFPYGWNFVANPNQEIVFTPDLLAEREEAASHIKLLHFAGLQPWREAKDLSYEEFFWFYARKSMYYEILREQEHKIQNIEQEDMEKEHYKII